MPVCRQDPDAHCPRMMACTSCRCRRGFSWARARATRTRACWSHRACPHWVRLLVGFDLHSCDSNLDRGQQLPAQIRGAIFTALLVTGHLHPPFLAILDEIKAGLRYMFQTESPYTCLISGTGETPCGPAGSCNKTCMQHRCACKGKRHAMGWSNA